MHRAHRVDEPGHGVQADALRRAHRHLEVAHVVQRVVGGVVTDPVCGDSLGRAFHHVVGEELEGEQALTAVVDDEWSLAHPVAQNPHPFERVFAQEAHAYVEHRAADEVDCLEPRAVEARRDVRHRGGAHAGRPQALVGVA